MAQIKFPTNWFDFPTNEENEKISKDGYWLALDWQPITDDYESSPSHIIARKAYFYSLSSMPDKPNWKYESPEKGSTGLSLKKIGFTHYAVINEPDTDTNNMTEQHEYHLQQIKDKVCELIDKKYRKGVEEHGGKIWEKPLDWFEKEIENEIVDLVVYFLTKSILKGK